MTMATVKREFLADAFFPHGDRVARSVGMVGASPEVRRLEKGDAHVRIMETLQGTEFDAAVTMAQWFLDGLGHQTLEQLSEEQRLARFWVACQHHMPEYLATAEAVSSNE